MSYRKGAKKDAGGKKRKLSPAALNLKRLRGLSGLSIAGMAKELGMPVSSYQHYEARLKKPKLPPGLAKRVHDVLRARGIPEADLASLGIVQEVHDNVTALAREVSELRGMVSLLLKHLKITPS